MKITPITTIGISSIILSIIMYIGCDKQKPVPIKSKYSKGDIVCTKIGNQKGMVVFVNGHNSFSYDIRFYNDKQNTVSIGGNGGSALVAGGNGGSAEGNFYRIDNMRAFELKNCGDKE
jgi:hypothetical protein